MNAASASRVVGSLMGGWRWTAKVFGVVASRLVLASSAFLCDYLYPPLLVLLCCDGFSVVHFQVCFMYVGVATSLFLCLLSASSVCAAATVL